MNLIIYYQTELEIALPDCIENRIADNKHKLPEQENICISRCKINLFVIFTFSFMKNIEKFMAYCESKPHTSYDTPFGPEVLVFRVHGKIFALTGLDEAEFKVNLKCDPDYAIQLRDEHDDVQPGYHMNKKHWNTVKFDGKLSDKLLKELTDHSYKLVYDSLPKKIREGG